MKSFTLLFCQLFIFFISSGQTANDEKEVRAVIQIMEDAWNAHDYSFSGRYDIYDPNAVLINPVGMYWKNREQIIKAMQSFGKTRFKNQVNISNKADVRFLSPTVALAIVQGTDKVNDDIHNPDGSKAYSKGETVKDIISLTLGKKNNVWKVTSEQVTAVDQNAAKANPIK